MILKLNICSKHLFLSVGINKVESVKLLFSNDTR